MTVWLFDVIYHFDNYQNSSRRRFCMGRNVHSERGILFLVTLLYFTGTLNLWGLNSSKLVNTYLTFTSIYTVLANAIATEVDEMQVLYKHIPYYYLLILSQPWPVKFQNDMSLPSWIFKILKFYLLPNFVKIGQTIFEISRFFYYARWRSPPYWISEILKFYYLMESRGLRCITVPNFIKVCQSWQSYRNFSFL